MKAWIRRYFHLEERNTTIVQEVRAGVVGFLTIAYIIAVNPSILSESGGPCNEYDCTGPDQGSWSCRFTDPGYKQCVEEVKVTLISATCLASAIACITMGIAANLPFALAPGMGINAFFTYTVVGYYGTGMVSYKDALAAVFVEGWIFILISITGIRARLIELVPKFIMLATAVGIGMFLAFIGLQTSNGIGAVSYDPATIVTVGGCPLANRLHSFTPTNTTYAYICALNEDGAPLVDPFSGTPSNLGPPSGAYFCESHRFQSPTLWLGIGGGTIIILLMIHNVKAAILYGVLFTTFISWIPGTSVSYLDSTGQTPGGEERFEFFKKGVTVPTFEKTFLQFSFAGLANPATWNALVTFLYLDFLDATGTMFSMAKLIGEKVPGFIDDRGRFPRRLFALMTDGFSIVVGSLFGTSPLTVVAESAVGINEGGRTGITAIVLGICFAIAMFFAPIFASIPGYATGPALIVVGSMLMAESLHINWGSMQEGFPAFITIIMMPLSYSIAYGVLGGICSALALWLIMTIVAFAGKRWTKKTNDELIKEQFASAIMACGCCCPTLAADVEAEWYPAQPEVQEVKSQKDLESLEDQKMTR